MSLLKEIREIYRYFKTSKKVNAITFYSENGIYYQYYKGTINILLTKKKTSILYITSDIDDQIFKCNDENLSSFYINILVPFLFPFINTKMLIMTMPEIDKYHIKRSFNDVNHVYMFHSANSIHMIYKKGAFDNYDTIFCIGQHHVDEIRKTEKLYNLKHKELINVGYSWLEELEQLYLSTKYNYKNVKGKIIIAPSWSKGNILDSCIHTILETLMPLHYEIIVRPHPEYIKRNKDNVTLLSKKYCENQNVKVETQSSSILNILESSLLITDWSGIAIEFIWGMNKPVIYINTPKKVENPEYKKLGIVAIEDQIRKLNENVINISDIVNIDIMAKKLMRNKYSNNEETLNLKKETLFNWGRSSEVGAEYIINYLAKSK